MKKLFIYFFIYFILFFFFIFLKEKQTMATTNENSRDWVAFENDCRRNLSKAMDLDQKGERNQAKELYMTTGERYNDCVCFIVVMFCYSVCDFLVFRFFFLVSFFVSFSFLFFLSVSFSFFLFFFFLNKNN